MYTELRVYPDEEIISFASDRDLSSQMIRDFLDDFTLVVPGNGGKNNVSAACMEVSDRGGAILLCVSRNESVNETDDS
jgi:hypothetical protein